MTQNIVGTPNDDFLLGGIDFDGSENNVLGLAGNDEIDAALNPDGGNYIDGAAGDDTLDGGDADTLDGGPGNDLLSSDDLGAFSATLILAGAGDDIAEVGGDDTIHGFTGNDELIANRGGNVLIGGQGNDVFRVAIAEVPESPNDVKDFNPVEDTIQINLPGVADIRDLDIFQSGDDVEIALSNSGNVLAIIRNIQVADIEDGVNLFLDQPDAVNTEVSDPDPVSINGLASLTFIGEDLLDDNEGDDISLDGDGRLLFKGGRVGGLSGIAYDAKKGTYFAISDDRGALEDPRFYSLKVDLSDGTLDDGDVSVEKVTHLTDTEGEPIALNESDFEGIALTPDGTKYISSERNLDGEPGIFEFTGGGSELDSLEIPEKFLDETRNNLGFESLTLSPDQKTLYTANEGALETDGDISTADEGSKVRIVAFDLTGDSPAPKAQFFYQVDPIPEVMTEGPFDTNGLVELLALDDEGTLLALERSFTAEGGNGGKIYQVNVADAPDVSDEMTLDGLEPVEKRLVFDLSELGITIDNVEGMTFGPVTEEGKQTLVIVSDDNFDAFGEQNTQFLAFELDILPASVNEGTPVLEKIGGFKSEIGAEINAFDSESKRLFIVSGNEELEILDLADPTNPAQVNVVDLSALGDGANSVAVKDGLVAVAIGKTDPADPDNAVQIPGLVAFLDVDGNELKTVEVGALPDMVTFTPDGTKLLVANEGEPSEDYTIDPEGSISIIDLSAGVENASVMTADFTTFNDRKEEFDAKGVKLFGQVFDADGNVLRDSTFAEDVEPEYIAVSEDGTQAFVTLQENNAVAILDLDDTSESYGAIIDILPLGVQDHADGQAHVTNFEVEGLGPIANGDGVPLTTSSGQTIDLGGLSGLFYAGTEGSQIKFYSIPDRGPNPNTFREDKNGDGNDDTVRPFALPDYQARILEVTLDTDTGVASITGETFLTQTDGATPITGVSNFVFDADGSQVDEFPVDADGNDIATDPFGGDFEGIVYDSTDSSFWMVDEYRPAIYHFQADGRLIERFIAEGTADKAGAPANTFGTETLPEVYANRRRNRGFEAVALDETNVRGLDGVTDGAGVLYSFIQTPLDNPDSSARHSDVIRILAIDTNNGNPVAEYVYFLERNRESGVGVSRVDKIGDAVFDPETGNFFVIERDSAVGEEAKKFIFEINLTGATNILGTPLANEDGSMGTTLEEMTVDELVTAGIQGVDKIKVTNLPSIGYLAGDKPEGLALLPDGRLAVINDNDFGLLDEDDPDPTDGNVLLNPNPTPTVLGIIDFEGNHLDASDRDDAINLQNHPLFGLYQPDSIASFTVGDRTYYVTANEGDARNRPADDDVFDGFPEEGDLFLDEDRAKDVTLDPTAFPDADALQEDDVIGRIDVNLTEGDLDGDGDYDQLFSFGSRSFSIWDEYGNQVFDSGDDFESITAETLPEFFNSDNDENTFDTRSDAKGPEPEGITVGTINGRTYAFVGLERVGGIMVYEVTDPTNSQFVQYINTRDFTAGVDSEDVLGDSAPEGLTFISAEDSPNGEPLLVVTFEETDTVGVFSVNPPIRISDIQGEGHVSELDGESVSDVPGIITAIAFNGFYLQDPIADDNDATSEGIFVFTGGTPQDEEGNELAVGDEVTVQGDVNEFIPGGASSGNLSVTQLSNARVSLISRDNPLPDAVVIGESGRQAPSEVVISEDEIDPAINLQDLADAAANNFDPEEDAIDFYESLEGMRVTVEDAVAVSPTRVFSRFSAEAFTVPNKGNVSDDGLNERGGINLNSGEDNTGDQNPERVQIQFDPTISGEATPPALNVGDELGDVTGVVGYSFGNFEVNVTGPVNVVQPGNLEQEITELTATRDQLSVASYNLLNLTSTLAVEGGTTDPDAAQRERLAEQIVANLGSPDIIALQEIQDNDGVEGGDNTPVSDATQTLQDLVDSIAAAGGPNYEFFDIYTDPAVDDTTIPQGGVPSGNIRNAFLYNPERVDLEGVEALTPAALINAGVTDPDAFAGSRIPLIGQFTFRGETVTVINNHLTSRFGSTPVFGGPQPFEQAGEAEREAQAAALNEVVDAFLAQDAEAKVIVTGDFNTFQFTNDLADVLPGNEAVLTNLISQAEADGDAYTFIFDGNSQALDHLFVTDSLLDSAEFEVVHVNNDFTRDDNRSQFSDDEILVASDHEPLVARFQIGSDTTPSFVSEGTPALDKIGGFTSDIGAEINAFDPTTNWLFIVSGDTTLEVLSLAEPENPTQVGTVDLSAFGGGANSVSVGNDGLVAVAVEAEEGTDPGTVVFIEFNGDINTPTFTTVEVGILPDSLTFTPDGTKVLVANEGEPTDTEDPVGSISIIDLAAGVTAASVATASFDGFNGTEDALRNQGIRIAQGKTVAEDVEPEFIAVSPDGTTAFVTLQENNALAVVDIASATVQEILPLGVKDYSESVQLDPSDRDGVVNLANHPVFGLYQPDSIASFTTNGQTYYVTANEGDARDSEEARVKDLDLDPDAFPNAEELQADEVLGRLEVTNVDGDTDGDGDFDQLFSYGGRSFSIWDESGTQIFDSGDDFERITAEVLPDVFNSDNDENTFDTRSDAKGPEPEGVTIGTIDGRIYAFVGLERIGGIMMYEITDPTNAQFVQYINTRDFSAGLDTDEVLGDSAPEGLTFISSEDSPNGEPLLVVTFEETNTVAVFSIDLPSIGTSSELAATVDAFNAELGEPLNGNEPGPLDEGRRGINWDGAAVPFEMPADFFNTAPLTRGVVFSTDAGSEFRVSNPNNEPNSAEDNRFDSINPTYADEFTTFSDNRLFTPLGSNVTTVEFFVPGTDTSGTVNGFGAIFTDVDLADSTKIDFFDADGNLLQTEFADPNPQGLSFVGATFDDFDLAKVEITAGNTPLGPDDDPENGVDVVAIDNFFYGEPQSQNFTLQILHASDLEGGVDAIESAPNFAAIVESLEGEFDNSILLSAGDNYIPGAFFNAAGNRALREVLQETYQNLFDEPGLTNIREGSGRVDISIMNILGFDASAVGNHEFDAGPNAFADIIGTDIRGAALEDVRWLGAQFPYLSANLDFSGDEDLAALFTDEILSDFEFQSTPDDLTVAGDAPKLAQATVIEEGGEKIGVVGATTQILESISSVGNVVGTSGTTNDMAALAAVLQPVIDALINDNDLNKVILVSHLQQIALEKELAGLLSGVDVIIAGGSDTLQADAQDTLRNGDMADEGYPFFATDLDGNTTAVVSTDGEYSYVGRLVLEFDSDGNVIADSIDENVSGAFATDEAGVLAATGEADLESAIANSDKATEVKALTDAINDVVEASDGNILGETDVFLEGRRGNVRTEETNLGNLTADANLAAAQAVDSTVLVSIKNGGGIRSEIGSIGPNGELLPPEANAAAGKEAGDISQLDVENALRFNNGLTLLTLTAEQLLLVLEHGVTATEPGATPGQFPQVGGLSFSFDATQPAGSRIQNLAVINEAGELIDTVVENGALVGDASREIRIVTLNFLANGGDGYPFADFVEADSALANRVDLLGEDDNGNGVLDDGEDLNGNGALDDAIADPTANNADFANFGSEQDALAEFLGENFPSDDDDSTPAFNTAETAPEDDTRIQNLAVRDDEVLNRPVNVETLAPNDGDGNGDGIPDVIQDNVVSLFQLDNAGGTDDILTLSGPEGVVFSNVEITDNPAPDSPNNPEDNGTIFPIGFLSFDATGFDGTDLAVTLDLPEEDNQGDISINSYFKFGKTLENPTDHWYEFNFDGTTGAEFFDTDGNGINDQVRLHFVDGQRGDNDITVNGVIQDPGAPGFTNTAPTAMADSFTGSFIETLQVDAADGVLSNDEDIDGDPLTAQLQSDPTNGTLTFNDDGSFTYNPFAGFTGVDSFTYSAFDGTAESTAVEVSITVESVPATPGDAILGTDGTDRLKGDKRPNFIDGLGGADRIRGRKGDDTLVGGLGADEIKGNRGNDLIDGGDDNDRIRAGKNNDTVFGGAGNDNIRGQKGDDLLIGGEGNDSIRGNRGNDTMIGGAGNDTLRGGKGDDLYVLSLDGGTDLFEKFRVGRDMIGLADGITFGALTFDVINDDRTNILLNGDLLARVDVRGNGNLAIQANFTDF